MAKFFEFISLEMMEFIKKQKMFFVASAPINGSINISPKGQNTFVCLNDNTVAYLDLSGAGSETSAHVFENKRITFMFCSFDKKPMILRLYGHGKVIGKCHKDWNKYISCFNKLAGSRLIIVADIKMVQTSCGFGVPICNDINERNQLIDWSETLSDKYLDNYWKNKNTVSIDGLPTGIFEK